MLDILVTQGADTNIMLHLLLMSQLQLSLVLLFAGRGVTAGEPVQLGKCSQYVVLQHNAKPDKNDVIWSKKKRVNLDYFSHAT